MEQALDIFFFFEELRCGSKPFAEHLAGNRCKYNNARQSIQLLQNVGQLHIPVIPPPAT